MKKQNKVILISVGCIMAVLTVLSFLPLFPSHPLSSCSKTWKELEYDRPIVCPHSANFWQYIRDDLKYLD